jgi:hypothetical protein
VVPKTYQIWYISGMSALYSTKTYRRTWRRYQRPLKLCYRMMSTTRDTKSEESMIAKIAMETS